jgi:hypothetical protein
MTSPPSQRARGAEHPPTAFVRQLSAALAGDARIEGFWLEADDDTIQWPPYARLDLHFAVPEPHLQSVRQQMQQLLAGAGASRDFSQQDAPLQGYSGTAALADGTRLSYRIERTSQIAKVPRRSVNVLLDRSGGLLIPSLSFEKR